MKYFIIILILIFSQANCLFCEWQQAYVEKSEYDHWGALSFEGVDCADSLNCLAIALNYGFYYQAIYQSIDGGKQWVVVNKNYAYESDHWAHFLTTISFPSLNKCVIGTDVGVVYLTSDMGHTMERINTPLYYHPMKFPAIQSIKSLHMYDTNYGIAASDFLIIYTKDGGRNWDLVSLPDSGIAVYDAFILSPAQFIFYGFCNTITNDCPYQRTMFITNDTGKTWGFYDFTNIDTQIYYHSMGFYFTDSLHGWAFGGDLTGGGAQQIKKISATKDGGKSWQLQLYNSDPPNYEFMDVSFRDTNNGIAVTEFGAQFYRTTNGGNSWYTEKIRNYDSLYNNKYYDNQFIFLCYRNLINPIAALGVGEIYYDDGITNIYDVTNSSSILIYPNPVFIPESISILLNTEQNNIISLSLYNSLGIKAAEIFNGFEEAGEHTIQYESGAKLPSGIYWLHMTIYGESQIIKPIVIIQ